MYRWIPECLRLYIAVFNWAPKTHKIRLKEIPFTVGKAYLLAEPERKLELTQPESGTVTVGALPAKAYYPYASVIVLKYKEKK